MNTIEQTLIKIEAHLKRIAESLAVLAKVTHDALIKPPDPRGTLPIREGRKTPPDLEVI